MFLWDFIAYNSSSDTATCQIYFSGDTFFRSLLCFVCKLITMQLNPLVIYYIMYHSRREEFSKEEQLIDNNEIDLFGHGPSVCAETVSDNRSEAASEREREISRYWFVKSSLFNILEQTYTWNTKRQNVYPIQQRVNSRHRIISLLMSIPFKLLLFFGSIFFSFVDSIPICDYYWFIMGNCVNEKPD